MSTHTSEEGDPNGHLSKDAAIRPDVNCWAVQIAIEDKFRSPVEARTHVRDARLPWQELLSTAKICKLQLHCLWVDQNVVWLDITMDDVL